MLNHILMTYGHAVTDQHQAMIKELNDSHLPQLLVPSTSPSMTEQFIIQFSSDNPAPKLYTRPGYSLLISYVLAQAHPTMIYIH